MHFASIAILLQRLYRNIATLIIIIVKASYDIFQLQWQLFNETLKDSRNNTFSNTLISLIDNRIIILA